MLIVCIALRLIQITKSPEDELGIAFFLALCLTLHPKPLFPFFLKRKGVWGVCFIVMSLTLLPDSSLKTDKNAT